MCQLFKMKTITTTTTTDGGDDDDDVQYDLLLKKIKRIENKVDTISKLLNIYSNLLTNDDDDDNNNDLKHKYTIFDNFIICDGKRIRNYNKNNKKNFIKL